MTKRPTVLRVQARPKYRSVTRGAAITIVATTTSACISEPARGTASNGELARVAIYSGTGTRMVQQETGGTVYSHSDGSETSSTNYRTVAQKFKWKTWRFYQGNQELDEQDWFALKDPAASAEIKAASDARSNGDPSFAVKASSGLNRFQEP